MDLDRRTFLKGAAVAGAATLCPRSAAAAPAARARAVLVDTTLCVGCRACEAACSEANSLPEPELAGDPPCSTAGGRRRPPTFTVVNRATAPGPDGEARFAKTQCLHCVDPACASACPVRALEKTAGGAGRLPPERCIGCRYCMVACPFGVPSTSTTKTVPYVRKCSFCAERQAKGLPPACADVCPTGALLFGEREELLEVARTRIYTNPEKYVHHDLRRARGRRDELALHRRRVVRAARARHRRLPGRLPGADQGALAAVPFVMTLWPPLLMGLHAITRRAAEVAAAEAKEDDHE